MDNGKEGAQKVLRFPRTVMEAVYGLNTYLQNQFSALADIYMPIEGITESKPLQEFVYRLCPSSIKAKSLTLDRIYGKTLAWNQECNIPNFSAERNGVTFTDESGKLKMNGTASERISWTGLVANVFPVFPNGHRVLWKVSSISGNYVASTDISFSDGYFSGGCKVGERNIITVNGSGSYLYVFVPAGASFTNAVFGINVIDLTLMFGAGKEPSTVAEFESMFPGYHDYSAGKLISNDAESIETVGFNQWDEEWEYGTLDRYTGEKQDGDTYRSKNYIKVISGQTYCFHATSDYYGGGADACWYDANYNFLSDTYCSWNGILQAPDNACWMLFRTWGLGSTPYANDICINISDPAKNGTYEPYRKSTMQLGLGSFQVRDSQGNVTTITGGLKSAGSVYDEIVGNKYIKRIGGVDMGTLGWYKVAGASQDIDRFYSYGINSIIKHPLNNDVVGNIISSIFVTQSENFGFSGLGTCITVDVNGNISVYYKPGSNPYPDAAEFKAAMSGVMLYYELATPIEYELVSPLVPTVKAGETEARISPNADGLSAPMVADMTYDAQANNDSASAQYALTAGRLLNRHKIWGQDFDGTGDVSGALTGVTSITMSGAISGLANINSVLAFDNGVPKINNNVVWHAGNSNKSDVAWACSTLTAATSITCQSVKIEEGNEINSLSNVNLHLNYRSTGSVTLACGGGNVGIGAASPQYKLDVSGTFRATGAATFGSTIHATGGIDSDSYITAGAVNSSSDARLKDNITSVVYAMDTIMSLKPSEWIWNEKHHLNGQKGAGLVAQEVEKVLPFAVAKEGEYLSLNYNVFHAYEIAGLQNHEERIKALEAENVELRRRLGA